MRTTGQPRKETINSFRNELDTLIARAMKAVETAEAVSPDFPERDDLVRYVRQATNALGHAKGVTYGMPSETVIFSPDNDDQTSSTKEG